MGGRRVLCKAWLFLRVSQVVGDGGPKGFGEGRGPEVGR